MDISETLTVKRGRAPVKGVMDSYIPTLSIDEENRLGDLHLAVVTDKAAAKEHAHWWQPAMREKIDTQTRIDPSAPFLVGGGGKALSAWVAEERNRISGRGLTEEVERNFADLVYKAKAKELEAWEQFKVSPSEKKGAQSKELVDTRWALTWKEVGGVKTVKVRLVATGSAYGQCGNCRLLCNPDIKNAFLLADGFGREVYLRAACEWNSKNTRRV